MWGGLLWRGRRGIGRRLGMRDCVVLVGRISGVGREREEKEGVLRRMAGKMLGEVEGGTYCSIFPRRRIFGLVGEDMLANQISGKVGLRGRERESHGYKWSFCEFTCVLQSRDIIGWQIRRWGHDFPK